MIKLHYHSVRVQKGIEEAFILFIDGLVQERRNSSALAVKLRLSCTNPSIYHSSIK